MKTRGIYKPRTTADATAAHELVLYADNESSIYEQKKSILKNLLLKLRKSKYDAAKAPKLWAYWVEAAAKKYSKEFSDGRDWSVMFTKATRDLAAADLASRYHREMLSGEHDYLIQTPAQRKAEQDAADERWRKWVK